MQSKIENTMKRTMRFWTKKKSESGQIIVDLLKEGRKAFADQLWDGVFMNEFSFNMKEIRGYEYYSQWLDYDPNVRIKPEFDQFIYSHIIYGELGNQMYRFASLYAMGQLVNRTPVYFKNDLKMHEMDAELAEGFPNFHRRIYFLKDKQNENEIDTINGFEKRCCDYADTSKLYGYERPLLNINGARANFENSKYFHHIRPKIIELFEFGEKIVKNVNEIIQKEFKSDNAYKICVHTRNGDFWYLGESKAEQVGPAIDRIIGHLPSLTNGKIGNYSLLLFGLDQQLLHSLKYNTKSLQSTYYIAEMKISRIGEFYLAKQICNVFLDTASLSSFAFWMGYLMRETTPKFFIRKYIGNDVQISTFDQLPAEWFPIEEDWLRAK